MATNFFPFGRGGEGWPQPTKKRKLTVEQARQVVQERAKKSDRRTSSERKVRRGYNLNALRNALWLYGFLGRMEGPPLDADSLGAGPTTWYLQFECIDGPWFNGKLDRMRDDGRLDTVDQFLGGQTFPAAWAASGPGDRFDLSQVYISFADDLAAENPGQGIFECLVDRAYLNQRHIGLPQLGGWFWLALMPRPEDEEETNGILIQMRPGQDDVFLGFFDLAVLDIVPEAGQSWLKALNYPNLEPNPNPPPVVQGGLGPPHQGGQDDEVLEEDDEEEGMADQTFFGILEAGSRLLNWFSEVGGFLGREISTLLRPSRQWELAGFPDLAFPTPHAEASPEPIRYSGFNGANSMPANAVGAGLLTPFVGVLNVGQGNLNMIVDTNHHVLAYYDFGRTLRLQDGPAIPPVVCFCQRPTIIISNFDKDHWGMADRLPASYGMRWIVPQEGAGTKGTHILGLVREAGGQFCVFNTVALPGRRYIAFPWGYIERCTGTGTNGSGTAAYVCVRETNPAAAHVPPGAVVAAGLPIQPNGVPHNRAVLAVAGVRALVPVPANVDVVVAVAAGFAASTWAEAIHNLHAATAITLIRNIARAAVIAAAAGGATAGTVVAALPNPGFSDIPGGHRATAKTETAHAAINTLAALANDAARSLASADAFWNHASVNDQVRWRACVRNAVQGWPAPPVVGAGAAPAHVSEGFIMLTGDAFFQHVPSSADIPPPWVLGIAAAHHGSRLADGELLNAKGIPWAPGSLHAQAAHAAGAAGDVIAAAVAAAMIFQPGAVAANVLLAATRVAAAASAAVRMAWGAHNAAMDANDRTRMACAFAAAAAAISSLRAADASLAGLSAVIAAVIEHEIGSAGTFVAKLHDFAALARGPGLAVAHINAAGIFAAWVAPQTVATLGVLNAATALTAVNATASATTAGANFFGNPAIIPVFSAIANAAVDRYLAGAGVLQPAMIATVGGANAGHVNTANALPPIDALPTNLAEMEQWAVRTAAAGAAALSAGADPEEVATALQAVAQGLDAQATAVQGLPVSGQIAYSYGVRGAPAFRHVYLSDTLGGLGHGHPAAVALYRSKGWHHRFNTSARANHAQVQGDAASPAGSCALSWDSAADIATAAGHYAAVPVVGAQIAYACPVCGNAINFNK